VASKTDFKTVEISAEGLEEINEKVRRHRMKTIRYAAITVLAFALILIGVWLWASLRTYTRYEVQSASEQKDNSSDKYASFQGNLLIYNNDGIVYRESEDELIWNQSFEM
jgi:cbb3-type cytochrome oxidase subunit 3